MKKVNYNDYNNYGIGSKLREVKLESPTHF